MHMGRTCDDVVINLIVPPWVWQSQSNFEPCSTECFWKRTLIQNP